MDSPSGRVLERAPKRFLVATEACGGGTPDLFLLLMFLGYMGIYRRNKSVGGASRGPRDRGACPTGGCHPISWQPRGSFDMNSKSPGSYSSKKITLPKVSFRLDSVWTPFDIPFLRNTEIGKKTTIWAGSPVNRLVPKITYMCKHPK